MGLVPLRRNAYGRAGVVSAAMALAIVAPPAAGDLIISQYYEGTDNNKWIEIYNSGDTSVDLTAGVYRLGTWSNAGREGWKTNVVPGAFDSLTGLLPAGGTYLLANPSAVLPFSSDFANVEGNATSFNGDDSVVLYTGTTYSFANVVDAFGLTGTTAADTGFSRKITINSGTNADFNADDWNQLNNTVVNGAAVTVDERIGIHRRGGRAVFWDPNITSSGIGGAGTWDATAKFTSKPAGTSSSADYYAWNSTTNARDNVVFLGTGGTVTLDANSTAGGLLFGSNGYTLTGSSLRLLTLDGTGVIETRGASNTATIGVRLVTNSGVNLLKVGAGTLRLTANNAYAGTTTVRGGVLQVNGTHSGGGAFTVAAGGTLGGTGQTGAPVLVQAGGTLAPGLSIGTLGSGNVAFDPGSTFLVEVDLDGATPGVDILADQLNVTGTVDLNGGVYVAGGIGPGADLKFVFVPSIEGPVTPNQTLVILRNDGDDAVDGRFAQAPDDGALASIGALKFRVYYGYDADTNTFSGGNDVAVTFVEVPEPAAAPATLALICMRAVRRPSPRGSKRRDQQ